MSSWRKDEFGKRPVRIANCSGYCGDPPIEMLKQATLGDVDFITGDYLAEVNLAKNAQSYSLGQHPGYDQAAWEGIEMSIETIYAKRIKVAINGGALNPKGLAEKVAALVTERGYDLSVAYVSGDDVLPEVREHISKRRFSSIPHLDSVNPNVQPLQEALAFLKTDDASKVAAELVSAHAYLGARGILTSFQNGADIVITGRVSDASPVIAAAWYWWSWSETDYDQLASALIAGHLIECSTYVTGGNFAGFTDEKYKDKGLFLEPGFPIAEVTADGSCVITKHDSTGGVVDEDTVRSQLLYELQGNVYLHSDAKAVLDEVRTEQVGKDRVRVSGIKGLPPPPDTKLAIFYKAGFQCQILVNATGYGWREKCDLFEKQVKTQMGGKTLSQLDVLEFQRIGVPANNAGDQAASTMYIRVVAQSKSRSALIGISKAVSRISLRHFHGFHAASDMRTAVPIPYIAYYPALWRQTDLRETAHFINAAGQIISSHAAGSPGVCEPFTGRDSYDTESTVSFGGRTRKVRLGDIVLARSGDKGSNLNVGFHVRRVQEWVWLKSFLSRQKIQELLGGDADQRYSIERVEFPHIFAVHFVVYGILGRGVSSSMRLDSFGKGFADYLRDKHVEVPAEILNCDDLDAKPAACGKLPHRMGLNRTSQQWKI